MMVHLTVRDWHVIAVSAGVAAVAGIGLWMMTRKRPTAEEIELERRQTLGDFGRIVDGLLLDSFEVTAEDGTTRNMLLYGYEIAGVAYECSQDVTQLKDAINPDLIKLGMPCSIRYQPGSPENSLIVSERWSGLREGVPAVWAPLPGNSGRVGARAD